MANDVRNTQTFRPLGGLLALLVPIGLLLSPLTSAAQSADDLAKHFETQPVTIIVGSSPGGGYDIFARLVARFIGKHLPGNPSFIVRNIPGGGQLRGLRKTMKSKPDGLTIGLLHPRFVVRELFGRDVPDFDLNTVKVLGTPSGGVKRTSLLCTRSDVAKSWEEIAKLGRPISTGANAPGGLSSTLGPEFAAAIGKPVGMIFGYGGASEVMAAFDRGELDSIQYCSKEYVPRLFPEWIKEKKIAPIFWWGAEPSADYIGRLGFSSTPYIADAVGATAEERQALDVAAAFGRMGRLFVAPPGITEPIYQTWKSAFEATVKDPEFRKAADVIGMDVGLATAEDFQANNAAFKKLSPQTKEIVKKLAGM